MTTTVGSTARRRPVESLSSSAIVATAGCWITIVLLLDSQGSQWLQRSLGAATWLVLALLLARESPLVRVQTAVVVVFATAVEFICAPLLDVYSYRFDNVPMYVPPGHGLVYLTALAIGRAALVSAYSRVWTGSVLVVGGVYATYGVTVADRPDVLGAFWFCCLAAFLRWGPSPGLYIGAAFVVTYLELLGTALGTWTWATTDPTGLVSIGNPPSGAAGGYGWFDLVATLVAPSLLAVGGRLIPDREARAPRREGDRSSPRRRRLEGHRPPPSW